jgi:SulP family sulfate permease
MILLLILRRFRHFLIMPAALLLAIIISHIVLFAAGMSAETAMKQGFLLSPFPSDMFIRSFSAFSFSGINLSVFAANAGNLAALMIVAAIVILLNAASVELTTKQDVELDHELSVTGIANIISAPMGSLTGCMALSRTILNFKAGATGRISGIISALFCGIILLFGAKALSLFPRPVLGGLLLYLGLSLLMEWVYDGWVRLSRFDYFLVITIVVIIAMWGFLPGVGIGLIIACMLFAINYSRTGAIRQILTGAGYRSNVERSLKQEEILRHKGDQIYIVKLQGFIFFGTAYPLLIHIKERVLSQDMPQVHFIVLDFRRVTDLDSSSILSFSKIIQFAQSRKVTMLFAGMKEKISHLLEEVDCISRGTAHDQSCSIFPDLDYALGWCEDRIIESEETASLESSRTFADYFSGMFEKQELMNRLMNHLERLEKQSGFVLFERGEPSTSMYFVESGEITAFIELSQEKVRKRLRTMGPGTVIGEMGLYLGTTRSATVVTEKASVLYRLSAESLDAIEKNDLELSSALHRFFVRLLANRLIHANEEIALLVR